MTVTKTFLWHDYETFGATPMADRPAQFAAIRTDMNLEPVGDPVEPADRAFDIVDRTVDIVLHLAEAALVILVDGMTQVAFRHVPHDPCDVVEHAGQLVQQAVETGAQLAMETALAIGRDAAFEITPARRIDEIVDLLFDRHLLGAVGPLQGGPQTVAFVVLDRVGDQPDRASAERELGLMGVGEVGRQMFMQ